MIEFAQIYFLPYVEGALVGLGLSIFAMAGSLMIGLSVALARNSEKSSVRVFAGCYVALFRGIPPLVLIYIVYFGLPAWAYSLGWAWLSTLLSPLDNRICAGSIALAISSGAYSAEIIRASIVAVHSDQRETARSLGMSPLLAMRRVILPQAFRVAFAPLGSEYITILKGTSLVSVIGVGELMRTAQLAASTTFQNLTAYSFAAIFYVFQVIVVQGIVHGLEHRMRVHVRPA